MVASPEFTADMARYEQLAASVRENVMRGDCAEFGSFVDTLLDGR